MALVDEIREACAWVAGRSRSVRIVEPAIDRYAAALAAQDGDVGLDPELHWLKGDTEQRAAFCLTLDAINFGSGWFPTLRKRSGRSGYSTVALGLRDRFAERGAWSAAELAALDRVELADVLGQDADHELVGLWTTALRELGARMAAGHDGRFLGPVECAENSAVALVEQLAAWPSFADRSTYDGRSIPFFKRVQIAAADLHLAGAAHFDDLGRLTMFADNLVPHVLRLDGVLEVADELRARIEGGRLIEHGSPEEVELRACAVQAVEMTVAAGGGRLTAQAVDNRLWNRGRAPQYKAVPRHRTRCTGY